MLFGTDGVRGIVDVDINAKLAYDIGKGIALYLKKRKLLNKVIIGCDTRSSSDTYVSSIASGLSNYGINVTIVGVVSTPMISFFVSKFDFSAGIMITASHNDYQYNGIKVFDQNGEKINKKTENEIEANIDLNYLGSVNKGKILYDESIVNSYICYLQDEFNLNLKYMKIVVDCANGSNYKIAPFIYKSFDANVIEIDCKNDGININKNCGANNIENLIKYVKLFDADIGFAFDGDGDRLRVVDASGNVWSGDDILLIFALYLKRKNKLNNLTVAGTVMTNLGLEKTLDNNHIRMICSDVGDKNLIRLMKENSLSLGGESSGHICLLNYIPSCDALYNSLFCLQCMDYFGKDLNNIFKSKIAMPSILKNINIDKDFRKNFDNDKVFKKYLSQIQKKNPDVKIVVRPSGTEPLLRIYVESLSQVKNEYIVENIVRYIKNKQE